MMKACRTTVAATFASMVVASAHGADVVYQAGSSSVNPTTIATPRDDWLRDVQHKFDRYGNKPAEIVFDGDSITNRWEDTGRDPWKSRYAARAADFGIEGDRVENVLWRLSKGQLDGVNPKAVVLLIGTNNTGRNTPAAIAGGIKALLDEYQKRCPRARIILMGVFPRGELPSDGGRKAVAELNTHLATFAGGRVHYVDITDKLVESDGRIARKMMPDFVHPAAAGYKIWAEAIQPVVDEALRQ